MWGAVSGCYFFFATQFCRWGSEGSGGVFFRAGKCERTDCGMVGMSLVLRLLSGGGVARNASAWQCPVGARRHRGAFMRPPSTAVRQLGGDAQISHAVLLRRSAKNRLCVRVSVHVSHVC